jgi:hypothetical protein
VLANAFDHSTVNERSRWRVPDDQLQSSGASGHLNGEVRILVEDRCRIVRFIAGIERSAAVLVSARTSSCESRSRVPRGPIWTSTLFAWPFGSTVGLLLDELMAQV